MDGLLRVPLNVRALFNLLPHCCIAPVVAHPRALPLCSVFRLARAAHCSRQLGVCSGRLNACLHEMRVVVRHSRSACGPICCCNSALCFQADPPCFSIYRFAGAATYSRQLEGCIDRFRVRVCLRGVLLLVSLGYRAGLVCCCHWCPAQSPPWFFRLYAHRPRRALRASARGMYQPRLSACSLVAQCVFAMRGPRSLPFGRSLSLPCSARPSAGA